MVFAFDAASFDSHIVIDVVNWAEKEALEKQQSD